MKPIHTIVLIMCTDIFSAAFIVEPILTEIFATTDKESKYLHSGGRINNRENKISLILSRHNYVNMNISMFQTEQTCQRIFVAIVVKEMSAISLLQRH